LVNNRRGWGFVDDTLTTVQFKQKPGKGSKGKPDQDVIATLVNFAAHPVIIGSQNQELATDFVGSLERTVEDEHGGTAIYFNGAVGDASPARPDAATDKDSADKYGSLIAAEASDAIDAAQPVPPHLSVESTTVTIPQDNASFDFAYALGYFDGYYDYENLTTANLPELGEVEVPASITTPVTRVTMGRAEAALQSVTVPGEAVTRLGLDIREEIGGRNQALLGLTQNAIGYIIPTDEWKDTPDGDYYEETVSFGKQAAPVYKQARNRLY
jgi:hypothetical protein